jgi:plexin B
VSCFRKNIKASAICQYSFADVQSAFDGPYMEVLDSKWREYTGKVPEPRPGSVGPNTHTTTPLTITPAFPLPYTILHFIFILPALISLCP